MILIADSGATKTDWCLCESPTNRYLFHTEGINPFHQSEEKINDIICNELLGQLAKEKINSCHAIYFYGAGCLPIRSGYIIDRLNYYFPNASTSVNTDLLGAARAVCGQEAGIACILGTGSNSCLYDGQRILKNTSPLGYILGDEGSGAYLGKRFISDCLKGLLPTTLCKGLMEEYHLSASDILDKTYRQPLANRFLANVTPYIYKNRHVPEVASLLNDCFLDFFRRNILSYHSSLPISFTGSVAWFFQDEIKKAALAINLSTGKFVKNPIEGLVHYHLS